MNLLPINKRNNTSPLENTRRDSVIVIMFYFHHEDECDITV